MAHKVIWTERAVNDLASACEFVERDSPVCSSVLADDVYLGVARLAEFPGIGRIVPEVRSPDFRELIVGSYRVVYRVFKDHVAVIRVYHCSRLIRL